MYCAASVYLSNAVNNPNHTLTDRDLANLEFVVQAMEAIARDHLITRAFLQQIIIDIQRNGLTSTVKLPNLGRFQKLFGQCASNIPLLARSKISKHSGVPSPLPGRLPLGKPIGEIWPNPNIAKMFDTNELPSFYESTSNKRKRTSPGTSFTATQLDTSFGFASLLQEAGTASPMGESMGGTTSAAFAAAFMHASGVSLGEEAAQLNLPHRASPRISSPQESRSTDTRPSSNSATPSFGMAAWPQDMVPDLGDARTRSEVPLAAIAPDRLFSRLADQMADGVFGQSDEDAWDLLNSVNDGTWDLRTPN